MQYHQILRKRDENLKKWEQRKLFYSELRHLLSNYVSSQENKEFTVAPHVMRDVNKLKPVRMRAEDQNVNMHAPGCSHHN